MSDHDGGMTERQGARLLTGGSSDEGDAGSIPAPSANAATTLVVREKGCTCNAAVVMANAKGDLIGHESSCDLHWRFPK